MVELHSDITVGERVYRKGEPVPARFIYPFFLIHMLAFGASGFFMAYGRGTSLAFVYMHGGLAIFVYLVFYLAIFGREEVKWMFINAALGVLGITGEMNWLLSFFGKSMSSYPWYVHVAPFMYYVLYTFLLRQALLHWTGAHEDEVKAKVVNRGYVFGSLFVYGALHLIG
jgi:hypothetical protein